MNPPPQVRKFGTFLGVYMPSLLTILGLIMYLRFGWVVGNLGLGLTIVTVLLASSITFITGLSASAIATNMRVGAGGEYYLISRSLGLELGGAIGIPLYLCRTLSLTFYSFGLAEALVIFLPEMSISPELMVQLIAAGIIIFTTLLSGKSASLVLKLQIPILIAVIVSVIALIVGISITGFRAPDWGASYATAPQGFWYVFAVFFPAVTGFTAGIGLSGDLKDPQRSIPRGTLGAIITGLALYLVIPFFLASSNGLSQEFLSESGVNSWTKVALWGGILIYPAIWGAILSSAFGSILSGPRVLQALANDKLAPKTFSKLSKTGQPAIATWATGGIALLAVLLGGLNTVAQFVSILFLTLYVMINISAVVEKLVGDPSYRPTIKVPWYISLAGSFGAVFVMFLISPWACLFAVIFELGLYFYLQRRKLQKEWGDARAGFWFSIARYALVNHDPHVGKSRTWRPSILVFVGSAAKELSLLRLADWFSHRHGIVTASHIEEGDLVTMHPDISAIHKEMDQVLRGAGLTAFSDVHVVKDFESGALNIAQAHGIAGLKSNTVMFGWPNQEEKLYSMLRLAGALDKTWVSTLIVKMQDNYVPIPSGTITIWWGGQRRNGDLMLLLAYLLQNNPVWNGSGIVVRTIITSEDDDQQKVANNLKSLIGKTRIRARVEVIRKTKHETVVDIIHRHSKSAMLTFIGLDKPESGAEIAYAKRLVHLANGIENVAFVHNGETSVPMLLSLKKF